MIALALVYGLGFWLSIAYLIGAVSGGILVTVAVVAGVLTLIVAALELDQWRRRRKLRRRRAARAGYVIPIAEGRRR